MNSPAQTNVPTGNNPTAVETSSVLREFLWGLLQVGLLGVIGCFLLMVFGVWSIRLAPLYRAEQAFEKSAERVLRDIRRDRNRSAQREGVRRPAPILSDQQLSNAANEIAVRLDRPQFGSSGRPTVRPATAAFNPETDRLLQSIRRGLDSLQRSATDLSRLTPDDPRKAEVIQIVAQQVNEAGSDASMTAVAYNANRWHSEELAQAIVGFCQRHSDVSKDFAHFNTLASLHWSKEIPRKDLVRVALSTITDKMTRRSGRNGLEVQYQNLNRHGQLMASLATAEPDVLLPYVTQNNGPGDVARAGLAFLDSAPASIVKPMGDLLADAAVPADDPRVEWVANFSLSTTLREQLLPFVPRRIARKSTNDGEKDVAGIELMMALMTPDNAPIYANAAVQLQAANPAFARRLGLDLIESYPRQVLPVLATAWRLPAQSSRLPMRKPAGGSRLSRKTPAAYQRQSSRSRSCLHRREWTRRLAVFCWICPPTSNCPTVGQPWPANGATT